ncbi:PEGA domain-containing protein [Anaeromyxobacter oryzae]|nr:PEGA domain-containing protein [Anaeromyxobacter oryzae]
MRTPTLRAIAAATALLVASGCASSTIIRSEPPGAKVYLNGEMAGRTPLVMSDTKIVGSTTYVRLVLDGYQPFDGVIQRNESFDVGACIGGVLVFFPFLWIMGYKPDHNFELTPLRVPPAEPAPRGATEW